MPDPAKPVFLVDVYSDPVLVRVDGRAAFGNSGALRDFFRELARQGRTRFVVDFQHCTSMDSTFLGVLAGAALELRRMDPPGTLTLARLGERNLELICNLGLHRLAVVDASAAPGASLRARGWCSRRTRTSSRPTPATRRSSRTCSPSCATASRRARLPP
jgi:anti-anti-sigma regulatory factor